MMSHHFMMMETSVSERLNLQLVDQEGFISKLTIQNVVIFVTTMKHHKCH